MKRPAVFFDRDGTLIDERGFLLDPARLRLYPSAAAGLRAGVGMGYNPRDGRATR